MANSSCFLEFFLTIFDLPLVEFTDAESADKEGLLYKEIFPCNVAEVFLKSHLLTLLRILIHNLL